MFEDNEAVIKMIVKGRSPTMRHVSRTHRVALDWLFDQINLDPKIEIKYIDTKNQLADILTKEVSHVMGDERVTAKLRPTMNLIVRMLSVVSSSTSSNPGRTSYGYQDVGKSVASDDRSGKPGKPSPPG